MTAYTFAHTVGNLKHHCDLERLVSVLDPQEVGANLEFVSVGQRLSFIKWDYAPIEGSLRSRR